MVPLSGLQHVVFCERQAALIHGEQRWREDAATAAGRVLHERADLPGGERRRGVWIETRSARHLLERSRGRPPRLRGCGLTWRQGRRVQRQERSTFTPDEETRPERVALAGLGTLVREGRAQGGGARHTGGRTQMARTPAEGGAQGAGNGVRREGCRASRSRSGRSGPWPASRGPRRRSTARATR
ncbi:uncharacterized protein CMC5_084880 [Chondromyces crocatus]|uniref:Uncharacterized protein n=1 Tax=Chondromyces crocatus TaxID=52 RepID=A0A0K1EL13_CHOCO|nr:uncharacterized protein CMC5_084880 [Chondromyces crocatus]